MDIAKELIQIKSNEKTFAEIIKQLETERNQIDKTKLDSNGKIINAHDAEEKQIAPYNKKIHIFKALEFKHVFDELYDKGAFKNYNINKVEVFYADLITETAFSILFWSDEQFIKRSDSNFKVVEPIYILQNLASKIRNFSIEYLHSEFLRYDTLTNQTLFLGINESTSNTIKNLLLNDELQSIINSNMSYLDLKSDLGSVTTDKLKKIKV